MSYIHGTLHLNLHDLQTLLDNYKAQIDEVRCLLLDYDLSLLSVGGYKPPGVLQDLIQRHKAAHEQILNLAEFKLKQFEADLARVKSMYPSPITRNSLPDILPDPNSTISRHR